MKLFVKETKHIFRNIPHPLRERYNGDHRYRMLSRKGRLYNKVLPYFWHLIDLK